MVIIAFTFHTSLKLDVVASFTVNSNILLHTQLHTCKGVVKHLCEPIVLSIEFFQALQEQHYLYKGILFYLNLELPNISALFLLD